MHFIAFFFLSVGLISCQHMDKNMKTNTFYTFEHPPFLKEDPKQKIRLGGFSGLTFIEGSNPSAPEFYTMTDRGPNGEAFRYNISSNGETKRFFARTFLVPKFNPKILKIKIKDQKIQLLEEIPLLNPDGSAMTGLPNREETQDELPLDTKNQKLPYDLNGVDTESIALDREGNFWLGEEYRPSILKFNRQGKLLKRFVPEKSFSAVEVEKLEKKFGHDFLVMNLPEIYNKRILNRGFEALTIYQDKLYALLQSSLVTSESRAVRILEFDLPTEKVIGVYVYMMKNETNKIGDMAVSSKGDLYILEQDGMIGPKGFRSIFKIDLKSATNLLNQNFAKMPEAMNDEEFNKQVRPVQKVLTLDLVQQGFNASEKLEGLTLLNDRTFAICNDQDFGVVNGEISDKEQTTIGIFSF